MAQATAKRSCESSKRTEYMESCIMSIYYKISETSNDFIITQGFLEIIHHLEFVHTWQVLVQSACPSYPLGEVGRLELRHRTLLGETDGIAVAAIAGIVGYVEVFIKTKIPLWAFICFGWMGNSEVRVDILLPFT